MKFFRVTILLFLGLFFSCSSSKKEKNGEEESIVVEIANDSHLFFSKVFEQVDYIPLETTDSALVGVVERFRVFDDKVCLLCDKSMLLFDSRTGRSHLNLSKLGNAPGEYKSLYDMYVDKETGIMELLDRSDRKLYKYSLDGTFIETMELPSMPFSFIPDKEAFYWLYNNNWPTEEVKSKLLLFDAVNKKVCGEYFPIDSHLANYYFVVEGNNFVRRGDETLFYFSPSEKIYSLRGKEAPVPVYSVDFGRHAVPEEFYERNFADIMELSAEATKRGYIYFVNNFAANNDYVQLSFFSEEKPFWSIYLIREGITYTGHLLQDDINSLKAFEASNLNTLFSIEGDYLYFLISPDQFLEMSRNNRIFAEKVNAFGISEQSNPLLVKCKFKKNQLL